MKTKENRTIPLTYKISDITGDFELPSIPERLKHLPVYDSREDLYFRSKRNWDFAQQFYYTHFRVPLRGESAQQLDIEDSALHQGLVSFPIASDNWPAPGSLVPKNDVECVEIPYYTWGFIKLDDNGKYAGGGVLVGFNIEAKKEQLGLTEVMVKYYHDVLFYVGPKYK